jgi:hypothetical protein
MSHLYSNLSVDINVNNPLSIQNTRMIRNYVAIDPRVRPLIMVVKHWTKRRELNDAAGGGTLSTYTWVNMILNYLQLCKPAILPVLQQLERPSTDVPSGYFYDDVDSLKDYGRENGDSLGALLFGFFKHYYFDFDIEVDTVCLRLGKLIHKEDKGWHEGRFRKLLCVEEPFTEFRNLGNSADEVSVAGIREEMHRALIVLRDSADVDAMCRQYVFPPSLHPHPVPAFRKSAHAPFPHQRSLRMIKPPPKQPVKEKSAPPGFESTPTNGTPHLRKDPTPVQFPPPGFVSPILINLHRRQMLVQAGAPKSLLSEFTDDQSLFLAQASLAAATRFVTSESDALPARSVSAQAILSTNAFIPPPPLHVDVQEDGVVSPQPNVASNHSALTESPPSPPISSNSSRRQRGRGRRRNGPSVVPTINDSPPPPTSIRKKKKKDNHYRNGYKQPSSTVP